MPYKHEGRAVDRVQGPAQPTRISPTKIRLPTSIVFPTYDSNLPEVHEGEEAMMSQTSSITTKEPTTKTPTSSLHTQSNASVAASRVNVESTLTPQTSSSGTSLFGAVERVAWSVEEDEALFQFATKTATKRNGATDWKKIETKMKQYWAGARGSNFSRTAGAIKTRVSTRLRYFQEVGLTPATYQARQWTGEEDAKILGLSDKHIQNGKEVAGVDYAAAVSQFMGRPRFDIRERRLFLSIAKAKNTEIKPDQIEKRQVEMKSVEAKRSIPNPPLSLLTPPVFQLPLQPSYAHEPAKAPVPPLLRDNTSHETLSFSHPSRSIRFAPLPVPQFASTRPSTSTMRTGPPRTLLDEVCDSSTHSSISSHSNSRIRTNATVSPCSIPPPPRPPSFFFHPDQDEAEEEEQTLQLGPSRRDPVNSSRLGKRPLESEVEQVSSSEATKKPKPNSSSVRQNLNSLSVGGGGSRDDSTLMKVIEEGIGLLKELREKWIEWDKEWERLGKSDEVDL